MCIFPLLMIPLWKLRREPFPYKVKATCHVTRVTVFFFPENDEEVIWMPPAVRGKPWLPLWQADKSGGWRWGMTYGLTRTLIRCKSQCHPFWRGHMFHRNFDKMTHKHVENVHLASKSTPILSRHAMTHTHTHEWYSIYFILTIFFPCSDCFIP